MQSLSMSFASSASGCSQSRFSASSSGESPATKSSAGMNGPSCSMMRWMVRSPAVNRKVMSMLSLWRGSSACSPVANCGDDETSEDLEPGAVFGGAAVHGRGDHNDEIQIGNDKDPLAAPSMSRNPGNV